MLTADLSAGFFTAMARLGAHLAADGQDPKQVEAHVLCVMQSESGVHANARNPMSEASGLIQFMPDRLKAPDLNWHSGPENFRHLSAEEQVPFVETYFAPAKGKVVSTAAAYTMTFLPADLQYAGNPDFVLVAKGGRRGWAYAMNATFDANHDARITVAELDKAIQRQCRGPRWEEIVDRAGIPWEAAPHIPFDLLTTLGIQEALAALGFSPGELDGIPGGRTRGAVLLYQSMHGLVADGLVGPATRASLANALQNAGVVTERPPAA